MFRSWGRVGSTIGGTKLEKFDEREDAVNNFKTVYLDKTGNKWADKKTQTLWENTEWVWFLKVSLVTTANVVQIALRMKSNPGELFVHTATYKVHWMI